VTRSNARLMPPLLYTPYRRQGRPTLDLNPRGLEYSWEAVDAFLANRTLGGIFVGMADRDQHRAEIV